MEERGIEVLTRCRDCKYNVSMGPINICQLHLDADRLGHIFINSDSYCSWGEPKTVNF